MPIQEGNIRLLAAQVMDDVAEGGGAPTGTVIADGASNAIFPDVSELDRAYGRVNLRKVFVSVDTADRDGYYGANIIVADAPDDANVSCLLFSTGAVFDRRSDAQSRVEAYLFAGPLSVLRLYGSQFIGQKAILAYQREESALPEIGDVLVLSKESKEGVVAFSQFVRITGIAHEIRTLTDTEGDFTRRVLTLSISDALRYSFPGPVTSRSSMPDFEGTQMRTTTVADAAQYYGAMPLAAPAAMGALSASVTGIHAPLVPSATVETPVSMAQMFGAANFLPAGAALSETISFANPATRRTLRPILPGSLTVTISAFTATDDGAGALSGNLLNGGVGSVDYETGAITLPAAATSGAAQVVYTPAVALQQAAHTHAVAISPTTRGTVFVFTLRPLPAPGTLIVDYLALGRWYRLQDNGLGQLKGSDPSLGTGSVDYQNGAVIVTLGALPDVDSAVLLAWGSPAHTDIRAGATADMGVTAAAVRIEHQLEHTPVVPATLTVGWTQGGVARQATADAGGNLTYSGQGVGSVDHVTGGVRLAFPLGIDAGTGLSFAYNWNDAVDPQASPLIEHAATVSGTGLTLPTPAAAGSVRVQVQVAADQPNVQAGWLRLADNGSGLLLAADQVVGGCTISGSPSLGTIDYATGAIDLDGSIATTAQGWTPAGVTGSDPNVVLGSWGTLPVNLTLAPTATGSNVIVTYLTDAAAVGTAHSESIADTGMALRLDLTRTRPDAIIPGSVLISAFGTRYIDREGVLYRNLDPATGQGSAAGSIDYTSGLATITDFPSGAPAPQVLACRTRKGEFTILNAHFRTAGAPIRPASLYVQGSAADGALLTATANVSGLLAGGLVDGAAAESRVRNDTGVVALSFAAPVLPESVRYNAVVQSSLPLDAGLLGLDPVRLPPDGRVPIFRPGNVAVIHHTASTAPATVANGQSIDCGRTRLARVRVIGGDGQTITAGYSTDLDAGSVTFSDVSGYSQPLTIEHRIEDMALIADAQINGDLAFTRQLTHDFPLGSIVSSALIAGDLKARVSALFDQQTWANVWADVLSGSAATATFNDALAPVVVSNQGALSERWALVFTSTTAFNVLGEHVGQIASGTINADCAPINPAAGAPYFTVPALGWGTGWAAGNVLRFNTVGALCPVWVARTIRQGPATQPDDAFTLLIRGDVDRP